MTFVNARSNFSSASSLATSFAFACYAELRQFGGVDAVQPDSCFIDLDGVAIDYVAEELHILANELDWLSRDTNRRERSILFDAETKATWCHWNIRDRVWRGRKKK